MQTGPKVPLPFILWYVQLRGNCVSLTPDLTLLMATFRTVKDKRTADTLPLEEAMKQMFRAYRLQGKMNQVYVTSCWEKIMGKTVARYTKSLYFKDGKLFVELTSAPLKHELVMNKTKVMANINQEVGEEVVVEVVFL